MTPERVQSALGSVEGLNRTLGPLHQDLQRCGVAAPAVVGVPEFGRLVCCSCEIRMGVPVAESS
jgi:hypothetical protein